MNNHGRPARAALALGLTLGICLVGALPSAALAAAKQQVDSPPETSRPASPGTPMDADLVASMNAMAEAIQREDKAIGHELRDDEELSARDIALLWQAAVEHSGTIRFAIEKLSRRDATGQPVANDDFSKRMLSNLIRLGGVAGSMWSGTPAGVIGGSMVQDLVSGDPNDSALSRVTDADMIILAKEVEALQTNIIEKYYAYRNAQERLALAEEASLTIARYYDQSQALQAEITNSQHQAMLANLQPLMQSLTDSARQDEAKAQKSLTSARNALSLLVGPEALAALEAPDQQAAN